ncbi:plasmid mobilization protein [Hymenobacter actinosclerus]|uniref:Uncharacterized protein n=1 Tax=Hymenobacter actinosclerus TaxID=82805 RepID=A0A1I0IK08_9BACT|nr:hypothetical protein [Hymenobacter actinosclerus]SET97383.1 hypothetical protein SAMN04487998_3349 [Hymenobacter actinosclerus]
MEVNELTDKPADFLRTLRIDVRVSPDEKQELQDKAKAAGYQKVSAYLRDVGRGVEVKESISPELRRQLVGIGTDLHQLAQLAKAGKSLEGHEPQLLKALAILRAHLL